MNDFETLRSQLTRNREDVRNEFSDLRKEMDFVSKVKRLISRDPRPWLLGTALLGFIIGGNRRQVKVVKKEGREVQLVKKESILVSLFLLGIKLSFPLLRPLATKWLSAKLASNTPPTAATKSGSVHSTALLALPAPQTAVSAPPASPPISRHDKNGKVVFGVLKQTFSEWSEDKAPMLGASLAYYTVFSLAPLLIISIAIAGFFLGQEAARGQIFDQINGLLGNQGAKAMQDMVQNAGSKPATGVIASVVGVVTLLCGASGVFGQLQTSLNIIWGVEPKPGRGILGMVKDRFLSFGFILVVGFLLLVSLLLTAAISFVAEWIGGLTPGTEVFAQVLNFVLSFGVTTVLFALIFKFLPDAKIAWKDVWLGAAITAALFTLGKFGLGLYLGKSSVGSSFGAAGSLIVLLLWVYYSAQILFFGAEFTQVWANRFGSHVVPADDAKPAGRAFNS